MFPRISNFFFIYHTFFGAKDAMGVMTTNGNPFTYLKGGMSGRPTRTIIEFLAKGIKLDANVEKKISKF